MNFENIGYTLLQRMLQHPELAEQYDKIARFTQVTVDAVTRWFSYDAPPRGGSLNRLCHLLDLSGVESPEMRQLQEERPFGFYLGRLMALDIISADDALAYCNVKSMKDVFRCIRGSSQPRDTLYSYEELVLEHDEKLQAAIEMWRPDFPVVRPVQATDQLIRQLGSAALADSVDPEIIDEEPAEEEPEDDGPPHTSSLTTPAPPPLPAPSYEAPVASNHEPYVWETAKLLMAALPNLRYLASDTCTDEDRTLLRELMGDDLFHAGNIINRLSSTRAHRNGRNN